MFRRYKLLVNKSFFYLVLAAALALPSVLWAYKAADFNWIPPFLARDEKPSIIIIFDNSGSMLGRAYTSTFNSTREYYGYFDSKLYYSYNNTPSFADEYFYPNNVTGEWNGNWLNWATMHRVDVARKVMGGGQYSGGLYRIESQDGSNRVSTFSYDASQNELDLNGNTRKMTPFTQNYNYNDHLTNSATLRMRRTSSSTSYDYNMCVQGTSKEGVLHAFKDKARMALFRYDADGDNHNGGTSVVSMSENATNLNNLINAVNTINPETWTPLAETLHTVYGYVKQINGVTTNGPMYESDSYAVSTTADPFYFPSLGQKVPCTKQNVILITDGESTQDQAIPSSLKNLVTRPRLDSAYNLSSGGSTYLIDIAYKGHTSDLRTDTGMNGTQTWDFYPVFAFGSGSYLLQDAARFGKFKDLNGNNLPDLQAEWDTDGDGKPDNYFEAESGQELEAAITQAFQLATASIASGTAAAVTSQTRSGDGGVYQALFFPPTSVSQIAPAWSGQVHAFLLDAKGNMREDTNGNKKLDLIADKVIEFDNELIYAHADANGDSIISSSERNATALNNVQEINFLWSTTPWLNALTDSETVTQRTGYNSTSSNRYIFTFVDKDKNMVADYGTGEIQDFELPSNPTNLNSADYFYNYLTLYESSSGSISLDLANSVQASINSLRSTNPTAFSTFQATLAKRQVEFIRGAEVGNQTISGVTDNVRSRVLNGSPWRLGDIIFSSPTVVGKPSESYHLIYQDKTYEAFVKKYLNRRQMLYAGANDGMLHAFNGGFYNGTQKSFDLTYSGEASFPLGMEVWGYVPYNLLPHLKWLMHPDYGTDLHAVYMDLKPRVFDARVFFMSDGATPSNNSTHPNGWGTILVAGMRLGGAKIETDINKMDGNALNATIDRTLTSAYIIMDITNPEQSPTLLGEITMPGQGFTTCYPTVMPMSSPNANNATDNQWYLVFGSGPANANGDATRSKLGVETSEQTGKLFVLDLKALVAEKTIKTIDSTGMLVTNGTHCTTGELGSFLSDPVSVDLDIGASSITGQFKTDVVYYGSVAGDNTQGRGKMYRLQTGNDNQLPMTWTNSTLIDVGQPITAAPAVAMDDDDRLWVYFGSGRFFNRDDIPQTAHMSFYGVKEPVSGGNMTWATVITDDLYNSTDVALNNSTCGGENKIDCVKVYKSGSLLTGSYPSGHWNNLVNAVSVTPGWRQDFTAGYERVLGQAAVLGGAVIFTSYLPSNNVCSFEGSSSLWALYYKTGTAYYKPIIGAISNILNTSVDLGQGMALTPNLHVGEDGATAFIQSSTGAIETIELVNPISIKSGAIFWRKNID